LAGDRGGPPRPLPLIWGATGAMMVGPMRVGLLRLARFTEGSSGCRNGELQTGRHSSR
jgi:hypothetical protein